MPPLNRVITEIPKVRRQNSTSAEEVARFQRLFPNPSWFMSGKTSGHQKLVPTIPSIDDCLMVSNLLKVGCLLYSVEKQPLVPLNYLEEHGR